MTQAEINRALYGKKHRPEADLQKTIIDYLTAEHIFAWRINSSATVLEDVKGKKRMLRSHNLGPGVADIQALVPAVCTCGRCECPSGHQVLWIEVKAPDGKQSTAQYGFQLFVESQGHRYVVARSVGAVIAAVQEIRRGD